jgi:hypothetical protein
LNFLQNESSQTSQINLSPEKLRKLFTFQAYKFLNDKIDQNINFAKLPSAKLLFLCITVIFIKELKLGKEETLIILLSA